MKELVFRVARVQVETQHACHTVSQEALACV